MGWVGRALKDHLMWAGIEHLPLEQGLSHPEYLSHGAGGAKGSAQWNPSPNPPEGARCRAVPPGPDTVTASRLPHPWKELQEVRAGFGQLCVL